MALPYGTPRDICRPPRGARCFIDHDLFRRGLGSLLIAGVESGQARNALLVALATGRAAAFYDPLGYDPSATYYRKLL